MPVITKRYVRKALYVEAVQVTAANFAEVARWCQGDIGDTRSNEIKSLAEVEDIDPETQYIRIRVHNPQSVRQTKAFVGDWILYTDKGYKIYTERAFKDNFEQIV